MMKALLMVFALTEVPDYQIEFQNMELCHAALAQMVPNEKSDTLGPGEVWARITVRGRMMVCVRVR